MLLGVPFSIAGLLVSNTYLALALWIVPTLSYYVYVGPVMALIQRMAGLRIRAISVAVFFFCTNLIGMGCGPLVIGTVSDITHRFFADESLRYALLLGALVIVWSSLHFMLAARTVAGDLERTEQEES